MSEPSVYTECIEGVWYVRSHLFPSLQYRVGLKHDNALQIINAIHRAYKQGKEDIRQEFRDLLNVSEKNEEQND